MTDQPIWVPPHARKRSSNLARFMTKLADQQHRPLSTYEALHAYSIAEPEGFWTAVWDEFGVLAETRGQTNFAEGGHMRHARFFPEARLNYAENLLKHSHCDKPAIIFRGEDRVRLTLSWSELKAKVAAIASLLRSLGTRPGDRVCAVVPNHAGNHRRLPCRHFAGGRLVVLLARFRRARHSRSFRPDRAALPHRLRRLLLQRQDHPFADKIGAVLNELPSVEQSCIIDYIGEARPPSRAAMPNAPSPIGDYIPRTAAGADQFRAAAFRSSALYSLFLGNHRHPQMHRPPRRRHSAQAS